MIDTHCHIDLYKNPKFILELCENKKIIVFSMTNLPSHFEMGFPFFQSKKFARISLGMHPLYAKLHEDEFLNFKKNLSKTSYIGEVGLDFSKEGIDTKELQIQSFRNILTLVSGQKKILSIHSRKAEKEVLELLCKYKIKSAIFHWYSGGLNLIEKIIDAGYFFSINPAMIKSESGRKIISKISKEKILTETDGPFITIGEKPINPGEVDSVIKFLTQLWSIPDSEVRTIIQNNFKTLLADIR